MTNIRHAITLLTISAMSSSLAGCAYFQGSSEASNGVELLADAEAKAAPQARIAPTELSPFPRDERGRQYAMIGDSEERAQKAYEEPEPMKIEERK